MISILLHAQWTLYDFATYLAGEVDLDGLNADILGARRHGEMRYEGVIWGLVSCGSNCCFL
jgi:hypothetical protein